jgi:hypothetical protein
MTMRLALKSAMLAVGLLAAGILSGCEPYYGRDGYYRYYDNDHYGRRYDDAYRRDRGRGRRWVCDSDGDDCRWVYNSY